MIEGAESAVHVRGAPSASLPEPLRYDLINLGREVLAQLRDLAGSVHAHLRDEHLGARHELLFVAGIREVAFEDADEVAHPRCTVRGLFQRPL